MAVRNLVHLDGIYFEQIETRIMRWRDSNGVVSFTSPVTFYRFNHTVLIVINAWTATYPSGYTGHYMTDEDISDDFLPSLGSVMSSIITQLSPGIYGIGSVCIQSDKRIHIYPGAPGTGSVFPSVVLNGLPHNVSLTYSI